MKILATTATALLLTNGVMAADVSTSLPNAKPGECYARVIIPAQYRTETSTVVVKEASERLSIVPAKYEWENQRVLVSEASVDYKVVAPRYRTVTEKVQTSEARSLWVTGSSYSSTEVNPGVLALAKSSGVPVNSAKSGQCFAEYFEAPAFETVTEKVLVSEASETITVVPAKYEWVDQKQVVAAASRKMVEVPASYETVQQRIKVEDARVEWKKGRGAVEKIEHSSGEIMCLVEVPAVYRTVEKTVMKSAPAVKMVAVPAKYESVRVRKLVEPARQVRKEIPAKYREVTRTEKKSEGGHIWRMVTGVQTTEGLKKTGNTICKRDIPAKTISVRKSVVDSPATVREIEVPAKYQTKRVRRLASEAVETKINIPAVTKQVSARVKVSDATLEWRPVLCQTNTTERTIRDLQVKLNTQGYNVGSVTGSLSDATLDAVEKFQRANNMATGGLTLEVLHKLGIQPGM